MIRSYQGIRVIAMLIIFFYHCVSLMNEGLFLKIYSNLFYDGQFAVILFFMLSGVVTYLSLSKTTKIYEVKEYIFYVLKKIKKIYPVYILSLFLGIILSENFFKSFKGAITIIIDLFCLQSYIPNPQIYFSYNGVLWFISSLTFCYLIANPIYNFISEINVKRSCLMVVIILIIELILELIFKNYSIYQWLIYINPGIRAIQFIIGMNMANILKSIRINNLNIKIFSLLEIISIIFLGIVYIFSRYLPAETRCGVYYIPNLISILFIFYFEKGIISRILSNRILQKIASFSMEFYMIHQMIIIAYSRYINKNSLFSITFCLLLSLVIAFVVHDYIIKFNNYKGRLKLKRGI